MLQEIESKWRIYSFVRKLSHHLLRQWHVACLTLSHYMNHRLVIVNETLAHKFRWNLYHNATIYIQVKCYKMSTKRRPFCIGRNAFIMLIKWCSKGLSFTTIFNILECVLVALTHWGRVTHICVVDLTIIGSDNGLSPGRRQLSHYLNQCWDTVNWTHGNKFQWNLNQNSYIFIQENAFENVVWEMAAILSRPQCVKQGVHKVR